MDDLIEALTILRKYGNPSDPTHCEHDTLTICINPALVSVADKRRLQDLGVEADEYDGECFYSYRFGSA
jgi:hypothetical protein